MFGEQKGDKMGDPFLQSVSRLKKQSRMERDNSERCLTLRYGQNPKAGPLYVPPH